MQGEQLEEALRHDEADRKANGTGQPGPTLDENPTGAVVGQPEMVEIGFEVLMCHLDQKNAMLAKSVSMSLVDVARSYTALAIQVKEGKNPEPVQAEKCLTVAEHALKLAEMADRLGDKAVARAVISSDSTKG